MTNLVKLDLYDNHNYKTKSFLIRVSWYFVSTIFFSTLLIFPSSFKSSLLRSFGAKIGGNVIIKPNVNIKYPWNLTVGNNTWIGEGVWIDNLTDINIGSNVCLSQGAYLLTGSHDYKKKKFDLIIKKISLKDGVWIGAKAVVCPGVVCYSHSVLSVGSIATSDLDEYSIYQGNPALFKRKRAVM
jgi:putative colanic acid biosynthesis acetyltransferase WcaF